MNLVGKIFIVLIFVMSILFMGFVVAVYATHTNWRNRVMAPDTGLEAQLKNSQLEVERLTNQMAKTEEQLATEIRARQNQLGLLETQKELLSKERDQLTKDIATKNEQARDAIADVKAAHESLAALRGERDKLLADNLAALATRDTAITSLVAKTDEANSLAIEMQTLQKQAVLTAEQLADAELVLRKFNLNSKPALYSGQPPQGVAGIVLAVGQNGMVEISVGSDDGLLVGHRLDAYRITGGTYLGKVEVIKVIPDKAVCKVLPEFRKGIIQANDRVSTGLKSQ
jgi:predicted Holliday junction resolvase-like endonuclease